MKIPPPRHGRKAIIRRQGRRARISGGAIRRPVPPDPPGREFVGTGRPTEDEGREKDAEMRDVRVFPPAAPDEQTIRAAGPGSQSPPVPVPPGRSRSGNSAWRSSTSSPKWMLVQASRRSGHDGAALRRRGRSGASRRSAHPIEYGSGILAYNAQRRSRTAPRRLVLRAPSAMSPRPWMQLASPCR